MHGRRALTGLLALALAVLAPAAVAWAHPSLVRSEPAANSRLEAAPATVTVWLDEAIELDYAHLAVYDARGTRVDLLDSRAAPGALPSITVGLPPLPTGSYVVTWRVISLGDGHAVGDAFAFGVGVAPDLGAAAAARAQANTDPDLTTHLIRWVGLLAQVTVVGALVFRRWVWQPAAQAVPGAEAALAASGQRYRELLADILVGGLVIGVLGALYVQARATGVFFWELFGTRWGLVWVVRLGLAALLVVWLEALLAGRRPAAHGLLLGLGLLATTSLTSHSAAKPGWLGPLADFAHQLGAGTWLGGIVMVGLAIVALRGTAALGPEARRRLAAVWLGRFSLLAAGSVAALGFTGALLALGQVPSWAGLVLTRYGQVLLLKLGLAGLALALALGNALRWRRPGTGERPVRWVAVEAGLIALVVAAAAVLTDLPPATAARQAATESEGLALSTEAAGLTVDALLAPGRQGTNLLEVRLAEAGTNAPLPGASVTASLAAAGEAAGVAVPLEPVADRPGAYTATGLALDRTGVWRLTVTATGGALTAPVGAAYDLELGPDGQVRPGGTAWPLRARAVEWLNLYGRLGLALLAGSLAVGWLFVTGRSLRAAGWRLT